MVSRDGARLCGQRQFELATACQAARRVGRYVLLGGVALVVACGVEGCLGVEPGGGGTEAGSAGSCVQPPVPDGDDEVRVPDGQGAGEVAGVPFDGGGE
jgi:hypothetical protein